MPAMVSTLRAFLHQEGDRLVHSDIPVWKRLWFYRHGFLSKSADLYDLRRDSVSLYVSDLQLRKSGSINEPYSNLLDYKPLFHSTLGGRHNDVLSTLLGRINNGQLSGTIASPAASSNLEELLNDYAGRGIICKPIEGSRGKGVFALRKTATGYEIGGESFDRAAALDLLRDLDNYLMEAAIDQDGYAHEIFDGSVNTIRIVTMVDPETGKPFIARAVHRFGTTESAPVDNWSSGGICAAVDLDTGELSDAAIVPESGSPVWVSKHPDTSAKITGTKIPAWDRITDRVLLMAADLAEFTPYVGWDVVVADNEGAVTVIEANSRTDIDLLQIHGPLLRDDRVRQFYDYHGVIS